ncbi:hydrolase [Rhodococcus rhodochrous]|uniref:adenylate/guanylate cyclase domain-containing protein n=1 Tax=Rhodococcus rhodochrous TaxID=1829 RepID=UPI0007516201|nr:adenylate/guanylate cyclase domain-containing protein [Rhodococcus rhodochrous]MDO1486938.1 adenylate/guanylate cyclase domain-containing protein [Rhodococcus rhodochrous]SNV19745.1 hydrolase [Rhodococcus rhodochrous]
MDPPVTRYIQRDGNALAYQAVGEGPHPIAWFCEDMMHPDLMWTDPHFHYNFERCAGFARSLFFQRRGFGLSDPVDHVPTLEEQADDVVAVLDDAEVAHAALVGVASTCGPLALVAARYPDRVSGLVLAQAWSDTLLPEDGDLPPGWTADERDRFVESYRDAYACWGHGKLTPLTHPTLDVPHNRRIMALLERCSATPRTAQKHLEWALRANYSSILPAIQCPTKVLHQPETLFAREAGRRVAEHIPNGHFYELPPIPVGATLGEVLIPVLDHVEELVSGTDHPVEADRFLGAVLFTDVVRSTDLLAEVGDSRFARLLGAHDRLVRVEVEAGGGTLVGIAGDGTLSVFDGPVAALQCAHRIIRATSTLGFSVRSGVHVGAVTRAGPGLTGMTVHVGARIAASSGPGEVRCSQAVRELAVGGDFDFTDLGRHRLKGVPGQVQVFRATVGARPAQPPLPPRPTVSDRAVLTMARRAPGMLRELARPADRRNRAARRPR